MFFKSVRNKVLNKESLEKNKSSDFYKASLASNEIMLDRFCNGNKIEFPFA